MRLRRQAAALAVALLGGLLAAAAGQAHEIRPALLDVTEAPGGTLQVTWKVPTRGDRALALEPVFPGSWVPLGPPSRRIVPGAWIQHSTFRSEPGSLVGQTVAIEGLSVLQTDVLVRITLADGTAHSAILRPGSPSFRIPGVSSKLEVAKSYWRMGVVHILEGFDHLLFLLALLLIVTGFRT